MDATFFIRRQDFFFTFEVKNPYKRHEKLKKGKPYFPLDFWYQTSDFIPIVSNFFLHNIGIDKRESDLWNYTQLYIYLFLEKKKYVYIPIFFSFSKINFIRRISLRNYYGSNGDHPVYIRWRLFLGKSIIRKYF